MKRTLSLIISFVMMAAIVSVPAGVSAEESTVDTIFAGQVNPLYADVIDESEICMPEADALPKSTTFARSVTYLTTESAVAAALRDQMEARQGTITLYYKTTSYDDQIFYDVFDAAMVHTGNPTEGDYLQWQWQTWGATLSGSSSNGIYYLTLVYNVKYYTTATQEAEVNKAVENILSYLDLQYKNDYVKVRAIYDYICSNVAYDNANLSNSAYTLKHSAYAAFINKTAVCQGYALMFYRLALEAGIDARIIAGDYNEDGILTGPAYANDNHGWNIVKIGDVYYNLDATWDGDESPFITPYEHKFFLMSGETVGSTFDSNHVRWTEYETQAFHNAYPMSPENYTVLSSDTPTDISEWVAHLEYYRVPEDGTPKKSGVIVPGLVKDTDFTVTYSNPDNNDDITNAGNYVTVTIAGEGSYTGTITEKFFIGKDIAKNKELTSLNQTVYTYDGNAKAPSVMMQGFKEGTDFQVGYGNNINAGTGIVTITGDGAYAGSFEMPFTINQATIDGSTAAMTLSASAYAYDGGYKSPTITVVLGGRTLVNGTDYTATYENNLYPGTAKAVITGKGNYTGGLSKTFTIADPAVAAPKTVTINLYGYDDFVANWSNVAVSGAMPEYKVEYQRYKKGWTTLTNGTTAASIKKGNLADGVRYRFRVIPYVTLNGKSYYGAAKTSSYVYTLKKISTPKIKKQSGSKIKISWSNIPGETGYQIARSTKKNKGYKAVKTVKSTKARNATIKAKNNKKYYYKIRAYKTVNGKKIYGPWSSPVKYKLR